jgi:hypothetical protein
LGVDPGFIGVRGRVPAFPPSHTKNSDSRRLASSSALKKPTFSNFFRLYLIAALVSSDSLGAAFGV